MFKRKKSSLKSGSLKIRIEPKELLALQRAADSTNLSAAALIRLSVRHFIKSHLPALAEAHQSQFQTSIPYNPECNHEPETET